VVPRPLPAAAAHKDLALCEGLGDPSSLIFPRAFSVTHGHSPTARSIGLCATWVCISSSSSSRGGLRYASQVLDRDAPAEAPGAARSAPQVLGRCARPLPAALLVVCRRYVAVLPRPLSATPLVVRRR
jgi:hypothetical protein